MKVVGLFNRSLGVGLLSDGEETHDKLAAAIKETSTGRLDDAQLNEFWNSCEDGGLTFEQFKDMAGMMYSRGKNIIAALLQKEGRERLTKEQRHTEEARLRDLLPQLVPNPLSDTPKVATRV